MARSLAASDTLGWVTDLRMPDAIQHVRTTHGPWSPSESRALARQVKATFTRGYVLGGSSMLELVFRVFCELTNSPMVISEKDGRLYRCCLVLPNSLVQKNVALPTIGDAKVNRQVIGPKACQHVFREYHYLVTGRQRTWLFERLTTQLIAALQVMTI